jgi:hypothetical protein
MTAGTKVEVKVKDGALVLIPVRICPTHEQLEREQRRLERTLGNRLGDSEWLKSPPRGRELT